MPSAPDPIIRDETGTQRTLGYVLDVGQSDKRARCSLEVDARHLNRHGVVHGGIVSCLLDSACGATASLSVDPTGRAPFLTATLTVNFIAPAREGRVEAVGTITGGGRSLLHIAGELHDAEGTLLASAVGVFKRLRPEAERGQP